VKKSGFHHKIACLMLPNFAIEVCLRDHPELSNVPLALAESELDDALIVAINEPAVNAGLLLNVTVAQGNILCPELIIKVNDTEREIEQSNAIYKKLQAISPFVEESQPGLYFLDASGFELLYPDDRQFAAKIIATVKAQSETPYPCRVGIGPNKFIAQIAANLSDRDRFTIVAPSREKEFLRPLPLERLQTDILRLSSETIESLHDLGLRTVGQVASFPANELIRRFGPRGEILSRLARGDDTDFFSPETPTEPLSETTWLDDAIEDTATIANLVKRMLPALLTDLARYSQGCSIIEVVLHLDREIDRRAEPLSGSANNSCRQASLPDGSSNRPRVGQRRPTPHHQIIPLSITVERPTLSVKMFLRQFHTLLAKQKLSTGVNGVTVTIPVTSSLLSEQLPLADRLADRSQSTSDFPEPSTITRPLRQNLFLPEQRFTFADPAIPYKPTPPDFQTAWSNQCPYAGGAITGLRLCQPPREVKVIAKGSKPVAINRTEVAGRGPWELSGQWWSRDYDRHYWEIRTAGCRHFLIYHDRRIDRWFLEGVFD
jgi:nucleotidyltransferase/DNA polymerase involved in DNA repair